MRFFSNKSGFSGNYPTWLEAQADCTGYDDKTILEKVKNATLAVKNGDAAFERDSVLFHEYDCSWPVLSVLLQAALINDGNLSVLDFGGSLGSSYFQLRQMIPESVSVRWHIVEQVHFVEVGKELFQDEELHFHQSVSDLPNLDEISVLLLSSVLPYIERPMELIQSLLEHKFPHFVIDRTPCLAEESRLTKQVVPESIYKASYPAWFLNRAELMERLSRSYRVVSVFKALGGKIKVGSSKANEIGVICQLDD